MKRILFTLALVLGTSTMHAQDSWKLEAGTIDPENYYGVSVSNGKIGMVSSPDPLKIRETVVARLYDIHGAGQNIKQAMFALLYSRLGNGEEAWKWFKDAYEPNLLPPFRVIAETKGGTNPYFITGAGGVLQAVMMGFGGLDLSPKGGFHKTETALPPQWKSVKVVK